jgi:proteasome-associated ATPase
MAEEKKLTPQEKIKQYEELLEEIVKKEQKKEGKIMAGPSKNGMYKVKVGGGTEEILAMSPRFVCKAGDNVIILEGVIFDRLPEELVTVEEEETVFDRIDWSAVGGMDSQIAEIRKKVEWPSKYKKLYKEFGLSPSKGILLHGPPGCGKTLIAKAIASSILKGNEDTKQIFIYLKGGELLSKFVGETENRIKNIFDAARNTYKKTKIRPVIFIDEAEAIVPPRGSRASSDVDTTIVPTFLSEMDGFEGFNPFVILASNFENRIDSAVLRPGRIDMRIYIGRPNLGDSVDIFKIHLKKTKLHESIETMAQNASEKLFNMDKYQGEISGALIENIVSQGIENAIHRRITDRKTVVGVTCDDLFNSLNR